MVGRNRVQAYEPGEKVGFWTVLYRAPDSGRLYYCQCQCGYKGKVRGSDLRKGESTRCAKCSRFWIKTGRAEYLSAGYIYGEWQVAETLQGRDVAGNVLCECVCKCGKRSTVPAYKLRSGRSKQCCDCARQKKD